MSFEFYQGATNDGGIGKRKTKAKAASLHQDSDGSADFEKTLTDEGVPTKKKRGRPRTEKTTSETSPLSRKRPNI